MSLLRLISSIAAAQVPGASTPPLLFIQVFESNSGGIAPNSSATSPELAVRNIKILNPTSLSFEPLHIGVNNIIGHSGLEAFATTTHSWELQIANRYDEGAFGGRTVYIVKAGQGGTRVEHWADGATYSGIQPRALLSTRVNAAIAEITAIHGIAPEKVWLATLGINDGIAGTVAATWKTAMKNLIDDIRAEFGTEDMYIMSFEFRTTSYYETQIAEIASEMSRVYRISTTGLGNIGDGNHLDYLGQKAWANAAIDAYLGV